MKICLFTTSFLPEYGGMEIVIDQLARKFKEMGHEPVVIAQKPRGNLQPLGQFSQPYEVLYYSRPRSSVWLLGSVKRMILKEHNRRHFDIIHAHMAYPTGYIAAKIRSKAGVPVVITSHKGDIIPEARYRQRRITCKRMSWAMENAEAVTGVSDGLRKIIDELTNHKANSITIPNGVEIDENIEAIMPASCKKLKGKPFMLVLCRLHKAKGIELLLEAIAILNSKNIKLPELVIAGDGKEFENLKMQAANLNINSQVIFAGAVFGSEKRWLMENCKILLQPSRAEGNPLTILEAFAYGKPVIGSNISGIEELITESEAGFLCESENVNSLANTISMAISDSGLEKFRERAMRFAQTRTWNVIAQKYIELFKNSISQFSYQKGTNKARQPLMPEAKKA